MTQLGTLRVDENTVRNSYGGFWFFSLTDMSLVTDLQQIAAGNPGTYLRFASIGRAALLDRIFVMATAMGRVLTTPPPAAEPTPPGRILAARPGPGRTAGRRYDGRGVHAARRWPSRLRAPRSR